MLDHDDLFSAIIKSNEPVDVFKKYIQQLVDYCNSNKIILLPTIGVMFSDEEKRISEYIKKIYLSQSNLLPNMSNSFLLCGL